jgi:hypothetical protein
MAAHARHRKESTMNPVQTFEAQYAGLPEPKYSWTCAICQAVNVTPDRRRRDAAGVPQGIFKATCATPKCPGAFEMGLPLTRREAADTFQQVYEGAGQRDRELDWARRRSGKTWDPRRAKREAPLRDGPTPTTGSRPTPVVPDPHRIAPPAPRPSNDADDAPALVTSDAHDDGYTTPPRDPATDASQWLASRCPGCGSQNFVVPPEGFRFEFASAAEASPASVPAVCQRCERAYRIKLTKHRLVRVAGATEAFTRAYEGTREATAPWTTVRCPGCRAEGFAPPVPSNLPSPSLELTCETCGEKFEVLADGSTAGVDDQPRGPREAIATFHQVAGDTVQATLAAEGAAVRSFREVYDRRPPVPGVPAGMRARIRQWRR